MTASGPEIRSFVSGRIVHLERGKKEHRYFLEMNPIEASQVKGMLDALKEVFEYITGNSWDNYEEEVYGEKEGET